MDEFEKLKEELKDQPPLTSAQKYSAKHLAGELLYSFVISTLVALGALMYYVSEHQDASEKSVGSVALWSLIVSTVGIFIFRQVTSRKSLKYIALLFLGLLILFGVISSVAPTIVCRREHGTSGYTFQTIRDIKGQLKMRVGKQGTRICYVPHESVNRLRYNDSFLYSFATFIER